MFRILSVLRGHRLLHLVDGVVRAVLGPGRHFVWTLSGQHEFIRFAVDVVNAMSALPPNDPVPAGTPGTRELSVGALERSIVFLDGVMLGCLGPGRYRWWNELGTPEIRTFRLDALPEPVAVDDPLQTSIANVFTIQNFPTPVLATRASLAVTVLPPGRYRHWAGAPWLLVPVSRELTSLGAEVYDPLPSGARVVVVGRDERVVALVDGALHKAIGPGRYLWWDAAGKLESRRYSLTDEPAPLPIDDVLPAGFGAEDVAGNALQTVVLLRDGLPMRALEPARYRAWTGSRWGLKAVPLTMQSLDVAPQDLLTEDQVPVRLKAAVTVHAADPVKLLAQTDWPNQVYTSVQLAMREVVTARTLEALLTDRGPAAAALLERARALLPDVGIALATASIKDVILPGEVKDLLNRVTLARKEAEAMAIKRREETAQTRQLANTARLLENNPVLMRLKELESLGDLAARIERITLIGSGDIVRQVLLSNLTADTTPAGPAASG